MIRRAIGIDFSGATDAGRKIWIAEGRIERSGRLAIERCAAASERLNCHHARDAALPVLVEWIASQRAVVGCDFPFSLPASAIDGASWHDFVASFSKRHPTADLFRTVMRERHAQQTVREPKRRTDLREFAATPWNAWNIRLYRQTHAGIGSLLALLLRRACIAPFDLPATDRPLIVETCPASTLKALGLYRTHQGYKGRAPSCRQARRRILSALEDLKLVSLSDPLRQRIIANQGGDALDSVIAAIGAVAALPQIERRVGYDQPMEGWVYYAGMPDW